MWDEINLKAELEIELLHDIITLLKQEEIGDILSLLRSQQTQIETMSHKLSELTRTEKQS